MEKRIENKVVKLLVQDSATDTRAPGSFRKSKNWLLVSLILSHSSLHVLLSMKNCFAGMGESKTKQLSPPSPKTTICGYLRSSRKETGSLCAIQAGLKRAVLLCVSLPFTGVIGVQHYA